ncbi:FAD-dependent oxidoreductase [Agromyces sp. NPDC049794]|uniref:NAD(P)/FAD-dependent oxidoreductase n=1 Tax=unclassified Agromyces TaxID=2639701 RepID=UPI003404A733
MSESYDLIVIGAGVAGLTAARDAARDGARVLLLERLGVGGQVSSVEGITNFPGLPGPIAGYDIGLHLLEEAEAAGADVVLAQVDAITPDGAGYLVSATDEDYLTRTVIVAAGSERRTLDVPGEAEFEGRGISHCASCDGPFFRDKRVIVVGGGDSAFDEARILAGQAREVLVVHSGATPTGRPEIVEPTVRLDNVSLRPDSAVTGIRGGDTVDTVTIRDRATGAETEVAAQGVFVYVGLEPNTEWLAGFLDRDESGRLVVDDDLATSRPGVFAAGDIRTGTAAMLTHSVADGERAARAALSHLAGDERGRAAAAT